MDYAVEIKKQLDAIYADVKDGREKTGAEVAAIKAEVVDIMAKLAQGAGRSNRVSLAQQFGASFASVADQVKAACKSGAPTFRWEPGISVKQFLGVEGGSSPNTDFPSMIERRPGIVDPPIPPTIFDVLPVLPMTTNIYEYVQFQVTESHNNAAIVAEGAVKPTSNLDFELVQTSPVVFAHLTPFSNQLQQDNPQVVGSFIPFKMRQYLLQKTDAEVMHGPGGSGRIEGLYTAASALTVTGQPNDRIGSGVSQMRALGYNPSFVIINSADAFAITSERATAGDGQYVGGVKFGGLPTVESANATANSALIIDASWVALLEREAPTFAIGLNADDWSRNLWTARAESRLTAAIFDLGAVRKVALS